MGVLFTMEPVVDLSLHAARPHVDTLLVINRLVSSTAEQLNTFALTCEDKLLRMHHKMQRLETGVQLLEAKLSSLPLDAGGGAPPPPTATAAPPPAAPAGGALAPPPIAGAPPPPPPIGAPGAQPPPPPPGAAAAADAPPPPPPEPERPVMKLKDDPRFIKYFKMEKVGVPRPVCAHKMSTETGIPAAKCEELLGTPDAPTLPGGGEDEE